MNRRLVFIGLVFSGLLLITYLVFSLLQYNAKTTYILFSLNDVNSAVIYEVKNNGIETEVKEIKEDSEVRLNKFQDYSLSYKASDGYSNGKQDFYTSNDLGEVTINPYYSNARLALLSAQERGKIIEVIQSYLGTSNTNYSVDKVELLGYGETSGATLKYSGNDFFNLDTLRIALIKKDGSWMVLNKKPELVLTKFNTENISVELLEKINEL